LASNSNATTASSTRIIYGGAYPIP
jgi:hypothetical protein